MRIPDNQNIYTGGHDTGILATSNKREEVRKVIALRAISEMSVWDLLAQKDVAYIESSLGRKNEENKNKKVLELGRRHIPNGEEHYVAYTNNILAFLTVNKTDIVIHSRFCNSDNDLFLYFLLEKVGGMSVTHLLSKSGKISALDLYPYFFARLLKNAVSQGVFKSYVKHSYNDNKVKGYIDVARHIKSNIPFNGKVAYSTREHSEDNHVTQLVRHTIEYMTTNKMWPCMDKETASVVELICSLTPSYSANKRHNIIRQNETNNAIHPYYDKYKALQQLCLAILKQKRSGYGDDSSHKINGILIDGAWLWEEYMAVVLREQFDHFTQKSAFDLFKSPEEKYFQKIIPDYLSKGWTDGEDAHAEAVADAKYMRLEDRLKLQGEQAYSVYYKTIMYMHRFNSQKGFIFYPMEANAEGSAHDIKELSIAGTDSKIYMCGFRIPKIEASKDPERFTKFKSAMENAEREFRTEVSTKLTNK